MAIKSYNSMADYQAAVKPTYESQVSMIEPTREIFVDGVNVVTTEPVAGDVVFLNDQNKIIFVKGGEWIRKESIPVAWIHVGYVYFRKGRQVGVIHKESSDRQWLDVSQFAWTDVELDGTEHSKTIGLRFGIPNWDTTTSITFTYTATTLTEAAAACTSAIEAKLAELGASTTTISEWWAYADSANNRVIVQNDSCRDNRFYNCSGLTHISWGDMPGKPNYWRGERGYLTGYRGAMNVKRVKAWAASGGRVPNTQEPVGPRSGNDAPVKPSEFANSELCANLRDAYTTYEEYIEKCYAVVYPQMFGCFSLPNGKDIMKLYAYMTAPTKSGATKPKYPALYYGYNKSFGVTHLDLGDWYLPGVDDGVILMKDATIATLNQSVAKMETTPINNNTSCWFAQRQNANGAWFFNSNYGFLYNTYVNIVYRCYAVAILNI